MEGTASHSGVSAVDINIENTSQETIAQQFSNIQMIS